MRKHRYDSDVYHLLALREERRDGQKIRYDVNDAKLKDIVADIDSSNWRLILRAKNKGICLNLLVTTVTGAVLFAMEFSGFMRTLWCYPP